jgi:hypothetical protein
MLLLLEPNAVGFAQTFNSNRYIAHDTKVESRKQKAEITTKSKAANTKTEIEKAENRNHKRKVKSS